MDNKEIEYCNWTFWDCLKPNNKWVVGRDCQGGREGDTTITLSRGDSKNWRAYKASLEPTHQFYPPPFSSKCPNCGKYINSVNPYDNGETWRM